MSITIHDVAREAGVSISTVSKVIHGSGRISLETSERVRQIMEKLRFQPNNIARAFAQQTAGTIGVLMELHAHSVSVTPHNYEILGGIESVMQENGYLLSLSNIATQADLKNVMDMMVRAKRIDGFIFHSSFLTLDVLRYLKTNSVPHVIIGETETGQSSCWVDVDNTEAGRLAGRHIAGIGRRRVAFLGGPDNDKISYRRYLGLAEELEVAEVPFDPRLRSVDCRDFASGQAAMAGILSDPSRQGVDAVVCSSNFVAAGAMRAAVQAGRSIPADIAFIGFDDYPLAPFLEPPLTIVAMDMYGLGLHAGKAMLYTLKNPGMGISFRMLAPELIVRQSTLPD